MQKHDQAANSLPIFLEVVKRFPSTRAARDALYTAAVCHERLHEYNEFWRDIYSHGGHAGPAMVNYADVRRTYPGYALPLGTSGWEPATRTVNGGPALAPPPKKPPRPSRWEKVKPYLDLISYDIRKATQVALRAAYSLIFKLVVSVFSWFYHFGCACVSALGLWFVALNAGEPRRLLGERLSGCNSRPAELADDSYAVIELGSFAAMSNRYLGRDLRDQWLEGGRDLVFKVRQLDQSGRTALCRTVAAYLLGGLLCLALIENLLKM